jgi:hypothetical protein
MKIDETKVVWGVDYGDRYLSDISESVITAQRVAQRYHVKQVTVVKIDGKWYIPGYIAPPSSDDCEKQAQMDKIEALKSKLGDYDLTDEEMDMLFG